MVLLGTSCICNTLATSAAGANAPSARTSHRSVRSKRELSHDSPCNLRLQRTGMTGALRNAGNLESSEVCTVALLVFVLHFGAFRNRDPENMMFCNLFDDILCSMAKG